ncbi:response regulator [Herbaspirillum seropedicae]|uniref:response regulator n=1 Tax=Herbaspirillum seropedicae TaxID=964 RepID=UPI0011229316|nr:response regulator [Herbaspirillum seropedicae]QDD65841.1 response regulator [Herbaspirillum seropedicae]
MHGASGTSTVLVVEDNSEVRALYSEVLRSDGYRVLEAANGTLALSVLRDHAADVDVILTDLRMPLMDGLELAETLKADGRFSAIPLVLLSATPMANSWHARKNFAALLTKPCPLNLLLSTIEAVL